MNSQCDRLKRIQAIAACLIPRLIRTSATSALLWGALIANEGNTPRKNIAKAQSLPTVVTDDTTGTQIQQFFSDFLVTGGTVEGRNLFHSFETFSPETAYTRFWLASPDYAGAADNVTNVFSRVTGSSPSSLNGPLEVLGGANPNFFLLNPNGILMGPGANVSIPGSFFLSTAESLLFEDGSTFSANTSSANRVASSSMLSISTPIGVQFGEKANAIAVDGTSRDGRYHFSGGSTVTLLGGNLDISNAFFRIVSGRIQLGSVGPGAQVLFDAETHATTYTADTPLQAITLFNVGMDVDSKGDVNGDGSIEGGGDLQIKGGQVSSDRIFLISQTTGNEDGGLIDISADSLTMKDTQIGSAVFDRPDVPDVPDMVASGRGSDINITAKDSFETQGSFLISAETLSDGAGGNISISAKTISLEGSSEPNELVILSNFISTNAYGSGNGGNITLRASEIEAGGSTQIGASTFGLSIDQMNRDLTSEARQLGKVGNGGSISIYTDRLTLRALAQIGSTTFGDGRAGNVTVEATDSVDISGFYTPINASPDIPVGGSYSSGLFTSAERRIGTNEVSTGDGGNLNVMTPLLKLSDGGLLSVATSGEGNAGTLTLTADEILVSDPVLTIDSTLSGIVASVSEFGSGQGGTLDITSDRIHLFNGGQIAASTDGAGDAGNVTIRADIVDVEGASADGRIDDQVSSAIVSRSSTAANAGTITLLNRESTDLQNRINLTESGTLSVSSLAGGDAGNIQLRAGTLYLNDGRIQADASSGSQGNIDIEAKDVVLLRQNSLLTTNATETATGGNIVINSPVVVGLENSDISANAVEGNGGNIRLITNGLVGIALRDRATSKSDITASSEFGISGTIAVESPNVDTDRGLVQLPDGLVDASDQITAACAAQDGNQFASTGRGGLPNNPLQQLNSNRPWQDFRAIAQAPSLAHQPSSRVDAIELSSAHSELLEAGQWQLNESGEVMLFAERAIAPSPSGCLQKVVSTVSMAQ